VVADLETLSRSEPEGNSDALFAHRQLAELRLEKSPWRAALHLRQLVKADAADDGVHALMGLCQALLGNFNAAVGSYRRATRRAPRNPWYHHNLGHLLDVGVGDSARAVAHLRIAHELEPDEDEITASMAHCVARLGRLEEATELAREALAAAPHSDEHRALLAWIEDGAPERTRRKRTGSAAPGGPDAAEGRDLDDAGAGFGDARLRDARLRDARLRDEPSDAEMRLLERELAQQEGTEQVAQLLAKRMPQAGFTDEHVQRALVLWADFCSDRELRVLKAATYAAAIEYAIARVDRVPGMTQTIVASRYGVAPGSISNRYGEIRAALELVPGDPRYRASR
jgi:tetratricopeptide (TPR) repeat protein